MTRRLVLLVALVLGLLGVAPFASADASASPGPAPAGRQDGDTATGWYVALGDSLAAGYQPDRRDDRHRGYVGPVLVAFQQISPKTRLVNLSCSGETSVSFLDGSICSYQKGNQLAQALHFLHAHGQHTRLITIDIGGNDARTCITPSGVDLACYQATLTRLGGNLGMILGQLRAAAPHARLVVLNYADPYLAAWLTGPAGQAFAQGSVGGIAQLNAVIAGAAGSVGAPVADISAAFATTDWTPVPVPGLGTVPLNVARICQWTWMCTSYQDIHPNDTGYAAMARAVVAVLPAAAKAA